MPLFDHLGVTVNDLPRSIAQFDPVMQALGCTRLDAENSVSWYKDDEELILFPAREAGSGPHRHGRVGWQHLAFAVDSRTEVDRLHAIALGAGWTAVREPKLYPRFKDDPYPKPSTTCTFRRQMSTRPSHLSAEADLFVHTVSDSGENLLSRAPLVWDRSAGRWPRVTTTVTRT